MSNISLDQYARPTGLIMRAYSQVTNVAAQWAASSGNTEAADALAGWPGVDLFERITVLLLHAQGYDPDLLDTALMANPPDGWTLADLDAELERTRGRWPADQGGEG